MNLNEVTCFLPFNKSITEDLAGNTQWTLLNSESGATKLVNYNYRNSSSKCAYINNLNNGQIQHSIKSVSTSLFNFGSQDFTISLWFMTGSINSMRSALFYTTETDFYGVGCVVFDNKVDYVIGNGNNPWTFVQKGSTTIEPLRWYHLAFVRNGGNVYGFIDGKLDIQGTIDSNYIVQPRSGESAYIGRWGGNVYGGEFLISELMVDIGHCWYTDEFTPQSFLDNKLLNNIILGE